MPVPTPAELRLWLAGPADPCGIPPHLWNILSSGEKDRANRFVRDEDRALFVLTRATLRHLLGAATGVLAQYIAFAEGPYGKPHLAGTTGPHFNVSHSGSFALIGLSASRPIGVDIERMRPALDELNLARSFFSDAEYRALAGMDEGARRSTFYKIWTAKEAVLKACGRGISRHLKDFSIDVTESGYSIHPEPGGIFPPIGSFTIAPIEVPEGYEACYALA